MPSTKKQPLSANSSKAATTPPDDIIYHQAFNNSIQPNILFTVSTGKMIMANTAACKLLGYSKKELLTKNRSSIFNVNESSFKKMLKQRTAEGSSVAYVTVTKKNGILLPCEITSAVFTDNNGTLKSIYTIADMSKRIMEQKGIDRVKEKAVADDIILAKSKQKIIDIKNKKTVAANISLAASKQKKIDIEKEKLVTQNILLALVKADFLQIKNNEWIKNIGKTSYDVMWDWDVATGKIYVGDSITEMFGCKAKNNIVDFANFIKSILPDEKDAVEKNLAKELNSASGWWNDDFKIRRADGSILCTVSRAVIVRAADGKAAHLIGAIKDVTDIKLLQKKLDEQNELTNEDAEKIIVAAKTAERLDLGRELHDNVNQLLGASKLYLEMAKRKRGNKSLYLARSSEYTLMAIEEIRKLSKGLTAEPDMPFDLGNSIKLMTKDIMEVARMQIKYTSGSFIEESVPEKFKLNILRIVQEQMNNILKHAKASVVTITISQNKKIITLVISDNGIGFNTSKEEKGIGMANIKNRALYYNGKADFISQPGKGCTLSVIFPVPAKDPKETE